MIACPGAPGLDTIPAETLRDFRMSPENSDNVIWLNSLEESTSFFFGPESFTPGIKAVMFKQNYRPAAATDISSQVIDQKFQALFRIAGITADSSSPDIQIFFAGTARVKIQLNQVDRAPIPGLMEAISRNASQTGPEPVTAF